jgi:hypothetical protein
MTVTVKDLLRATLHSTAVALRAEAKKLTLPSAEADSGLPTTSTIAPADTIEEPIADFPQAARILREGLARLLAEAPPGETVRSVEELASEGAPAGSDAFARGLHEVFGPRPQLNLTEQIDRVSEAFPRLETPCTALLHLLDGFEPRDPTHRQGLRVVLHRLVRIAELTTDDPVIGFRWVVEKLEPPGESRDAALRAMSTPPLKAYAALFAPFEAVTQAILFTGLGLEEMSTILTEILP